MRRTMGWLAATLLAGCGGGEEDRGPGIAMSAAAEQIAATVCPRAYECCTPMQLMGNDQAGGDVAGCQAKTKQGFGGHFDNVRSSQEKGRARYRGDRLAECLSRVRTASCQELATTDHFSGVRGCEALVEPLVPPGSPCANDFECVDGSCHKAKDAAEGICQPRAALAPEASACPDLTKCRSSSCSPGRVCAPPTADRCFYSSSCAYGGRPSALPLLALPALVFLWRRRRASRVGSH
jgi:uncharacterized protein (TIGR03382 family)